MYWILSCIHNSLFYFIFSFVEELAFVVKQGWHCCMLLLAELLSHPDYLSRGSWVALDGAEVLLSLSEPGYFCFQSLCAIKDVPPMW